MTHKRLLFDHIASALTKKMIFIGGPRQVGKKTLSLSFLKPASVKNHMYLNWDNASDRAKIIHDQIPLNGPVTVLDCPVSG